MKSNLNSLDVSNQPDWAYSLTEIRLIANAVIKQISPRYKVAEVGRCNWSDSSEPSYIMMVYGLGVTEGDIDAVKKELTLQGFDTEMFITIVNGDEVI